MVTGPKEYIGGTSVKQHIKIWFRLVDAEGNATIADGSVVVKFWFEKVGLFDGWDGIRADFSHRVSASEFKLGANGAYYEINYQKPIKMATGGAVGTECTLELWFRPSGKRWAKPLYFNAGRCYLSP